MELTYSPTSPFMRKVMIIAHELGIAEKIKLVPTNPRSDTERLILINPLSKVPVLITDAGEAIYDSPVICEYLDATFGGNRFIPVNERRWQILTTAALADGILDAAILVRNERLRKADNQSLGWIEWQLKRVNTGLDRLEQQVESFGETVDLRHVAVASMLGYLPLRLAEDGLLKSRPKLANWYKTISQRPAFQKTEPKE